uniref:Uncharacterized protein n=1 Tax=Anguilla anguilla TaxID=7936 RepID=A0A0E9SZT7_ANGAN
MGLLLWTRKHSNTTGNKTGASSTKHYTCDLSDSSDERSFFHIYRTCTVSLLCEFVRGP